MTGLISYILTCNLDRISFSDRITDISRDFPRIVDLGAGKGHVYKHVNTYTTSHLVECDTAADCLALTRENIEVIMVILRFEPS